MFINNYLFKVHNQRPNKRKKTSKNKLVLRNFHFYLFLGAQSIGIPGHLHLTKFDFHIQKIKLLFKKEICQFSTAVKMYELFED